MSSRYRSPTPRHHPPPGPPPTAFQHVHHHVRTAIRRARARALSSLNRPPSRDQPIHRRPPRVSILFVDATTSPFNIIDESCRRAAQCRARRALRVQWRLREDYFLHIHSMLMSCRCFVRHAFIHFQPSFRYCHSSSATICPTIFAMPLLTLSIAMLFSLSSTMSSAVDSADAC